MRWPLTGRPSTCRTLLLLAATATAIAMRSAFCSRVLEERGQPTAAEARCRTPQHTDDPPRAATPLDRPAAEHKAFVGGIPWTMDDAGLRESECLLPRPFRRTLPPFSCRPAFVPSCVCASKQPLPIKTASARLPGLSHARLPPPTHTQCSPRLAASAPR